LQPCGHTPHSYAKNGPVLNVSGRAYGPPVILDAVIPVRCPVCRAPGTAPCARCVARMRPAGAGPPPAALDACRSLLAYEGEARELIARLKYRNDRAALTWLAGGMATLVEPPADVMVTWAPTGDRRRRRRGFDQAELLAAAVARRWRVPCHRLLGRAPGRAQTGLTLAARRQGPSFVVARAHVPVPVIVVDDVVTTGSTLTAAAWALRSAGAPWVGALTAARTPRVTAIRRIPIPSLPLSVPIAPPDVENSLKFRGRLADVQQ
jgi:predicted amidophosphoribosyltransferase